MVNVPRRTSSTGKYTRKNCRNNPVRAIGYAMAIDPESKYPEKKLPLIKIAPIYQKDTNSYNLLRIYFSCPEKFIYVNEKGWMNFFLNFNENYGFDDGARYNEIIGTVRIIAPLSHPMNPKLSLPKNSRPWHKDEKTGEDIYLKPAASIFNGRRPNTVMFAIKKEWFPPPTPSVRQGKLHTFYLDFFDRGQLSVIKDTFSVK